MLTRGQAEAILRSLNSLPPDKVNEVQDFVQLLEYRYARDAADDWSEEDLCALTATVLDYADRSIQAC